MIDRIIAIAAILVAIIVGVATICVPYIFPLDPQSKNTVAFAHDPERPQPSAFYESQDTYKMPNGYLVTVAQTNNVNLNAIIKALGASRQISPSDHNTPRLHITMVSTNTSTIVGDCTPLYAEVNYQLLLPNRVDQTIRTAHSKKICLNRQPDRDTAAELAISDAINDLLRQLPRG